MFNVAKMLMAILARFIVTRSQKAKMISKFSKIGYA